MVRQLLLVIHLAGVISWMAGILYLIRLYVYHASEKHEVVKERFQLMERRLYFGICIPAMIITVIGGLGLVSLSTDYFLYSLWFQIKMLCVAILIISTLMAGKFRKDFLKGEIRVSHVFFRFFNELPTLVMLIILYLVFFRP